jgi:hypothetical protein
LEKSAPVWEACLGDRFVPFHGEPVANTEGLKKDLALGKTDVPEMLNRNVYFCIRILNEKSFREAY